MDEVRRNELEECQRRTVDRPDARGEGEFRPLPAAHPPRTQTDRALGRARHADGDGPRRPHRRALLR